MPRQGKGQSRRTQTNQYFCVKSVFEQGVGEREKTERRTEKTEKTCVPEA